VSEPLDCPTCRGYGSTCSRERCARHACSRCYGSGHARCFDCQDEATRTSLSDRDIHLCAACGVKDDAGMVELLLEMGVDAMTAARWMALLPTMSDAEVKALCGMGNAEYLTVIAARCEKAAA
jgi:hypothetical protein